MKKKTMKKVFNAQRKLAKSHKNDAFSSAYPGIRRIYRVVKYVHSHHNLNSDIYIMSLLIKDIVDSQMGIVKNDGTVYVARFYNSDLFTDY